MGGRRPKVVIFPSDTMFYYAGFLPPPHCIGGVPTLQLWSDALAVSSVDRNRPARREHEIPSKALFEFGLANILNLFHKRRSARQIRQSFLRV
jgi:hypothetical protein